ncbi:aspartate kinase [Savagea sp. SN6]|uniref:Aspartokinase n=1 Tax=Savagea serpentis TaxID=2785297 RepID=A0A8J7KHW2_9BACL|nr:aspartate kinase [Savagea serpentis]MBF4501583.1 aspartate kinase [Savagea serpentis]
MKVCKFGGTSVASATQIKKVVDIVLSDKERKIVVVSAPGKRSSDDTKVTDLLIELANRALNNEDTTEACANVIARYEEIAQELNIDPKIIETIRQDIEQRVQSSKEDEVLFMDSMKAAGEDNNAKLIAAYFQSLGVEARYVSPKEGGLLVNERPARVQALPEGDEQLAKLKDEKGIIVFPGFFGFTKNGTLRTFNRGGSDITGSLLAAATDATLYENFTDVDSVFAANPMVVDEPEAIKEMTYREMRELAYAGFSVFHDEALMPAFRKSVPVCIKNTNNPEAPGTMIVSERKKPSNRPVVGIAADDGFATLYVDKYLMNQELGFGRKLLEILEDEGISFEHTPSGIDNMSVILRTEYLTPENEKRVIERVQEELQPDHVHLEKDLSMVVLVGEGMRHTLGLASRAAGAISRSGASIQMINQGSSEVSLVFGILTADETRVLKSLYDEFFK